MVVLDLVCNPREGLSICNTFHLTTLIAPVVRRTASASRVAVVGELLERLTRERGARSRSVAR